MTNEERYHEVNERFVSEIAALVRLDMYNPLKVSDGRGYPDVSLANARKAGDHWRSVAKSGRDPVKVREKGARAARRKDILLAVLTNDAFETRMAELKDDRNPRDSPAHGAVSQHHQKVSARGRC